MLQPGSFYRKCLRYRRNSSSTLDNSLSFTPRSESVGANTRAEMSFCSFFGGEVFKDHFKPGIYACAKCGHQLFSSHSKYEHSSPWPAFTETIHKDSVAKHEERRGAYKVRCGKCGNGLGHEFVNDGPAKGLSRF